MKNFWKILAAMLIVALPFAVTACGSDKEEEQTGPKTYSFTWVYEDYIETSATDLLKYQNAINAIDQAFASQLNKLGYKALASSKTFTITTEKESEDLKQEITAAITLAKVNAKESCAVLKQGAKLVVKLDGGSFVSMAVN